MPGANYFAFFDQYVLLPLAWLLIRSMDAAGPAAGASLTFQQFLCRPRDPPRAGLLALRIFHPADELVSSNWRQAFPEDCQLLCLSQRFD